MNSPIFYFFMGIVFVWVLSYFYNFQSSRAKLNRVARWLNQSLFILGGNPSSRWQGPNTLQILLNGGRGAISDGAIIIGTQSKELFKALVSLIRGGRDSLNFLFTLKPGVPLANVFEVFEEEGPLPRVVILSATGEWQIEPAPNAPYRVAYRNSVARDSAFRLITLLQDYGLSIRRISLRSETPHLLLTFNFGRKINVEAHELLQTIRNLAEEGVRGLSDVSSENPEGRRSKEKKPDRDKKAGKTKRAASSSNSKEDPLTLRYGPDMSLHYKPGPHRGDDGHSDGGSIGTPPSLN